MAELSRIYGVKPETIRNIVKYTERAQTEYIPGSLRLPHDITDRVRMEIINAYKTGAKTRSQLKLEYRLRDYHITRILKDVANPFKGKVTPDIAADIFTKYNAGTHNNMALARLYNLSPSTISKLLSRNPHTARKTPAELQKAMISKVPVSMLPTPISPSPKHIDSLIKKAEKLGKSWE
jgi:hypothetical protein